jgi:hypothetical protein
MSNASSEKVEYGIQEVVGDLELARMLKTNLLYSHYLLSPAS